MFANPLDPGSQRSSSRRAAVTVVRTASIAATALLAVAACSSGSNAGGTSGGKSTPGASGRKSVASSPVAQAASGRVAAAEAAVASVDLHLTKVPGVQKLRGKSVLIVPIVAEPFSSDLTALREALTASGMNSRVCDGQGVPSTVTSCMKQASSLQVRAVVTLAVPYQLVPIAYDSVAAAKIPVLAAFQDPAGKATSDVLAFQSNTPGLVKALQVADDYVIAHTNARANVLYVGVADAPTILAVGKQGIAYLRKTCPECQVTEKDLATAQIDQLPTLVSAFVTRTPGANYLIGQNVDVDGSGFVSGLQNANKAQLPFGGTGSGFAGAQLISQGPGRFDYLTSSNFLAWSWTDGLLRLIAGGPQLTYPVVGRLFDSTNVTRLKFDAAHAIGFTWFGTPSYQSAFRTAWGQK